MTERQADQAFIDRQREDYYARARTCPAPACGVRPNIYRED